MSFDAPDPGEMLRLEQQRSAQLETYAADLSRTYSELRRHLNHMTVLHEVNTRIASALDVDEVVAGVLDSPTVRPPTEAPNEAEMAALRAAVAQAGLLKR